MKRERIERIKRDVSAALILFCFALVLAAFSCGDAWGDNLLKDYDISWGTGDGPVGAEDPAVASGGWGNLSPATDDIQATLDWIDTNWGSAGTSYWQRNGTILTTATAGDTVELDQTSTTGNTFKVERDLAAASTDAAVMYILQDNAGDNQPALYVRNDADQYAIHAIGTAYGVYGDGGTGNAEYGIFSADKIKVGTWADFDENNHAASPTVANPPTGDGRLYCATDDTWSWVNDEGKAYSWTDTDGDTIIAVEESADEDKIRIDTSGTQRLVIDATEAEFSGPVEATTKFIIDGTDGIDAASIVLITDVDFAGQMVQYRTLTWEGGILTICSSESAWTAAPLSP